MNTRYSEDQYQSNYPDGVEKHWWNLARNNQIRRLLGQIDHPGNAVLEVGCGRGIVVNYLRGHGIDCVGVELANVRPLAGIREYVYANTDALELSAEERSKYNTILLLDVIEHLPEPVSFIRNLISAFPNLTRLIITVPARQELWSNYDEHYGHYRRYSLRELDNISLEIGARIEEKGYFFHAVYPLVWLGAKFGKDREVRMAAPFGPVELLHTIISYAFILDSWLIPRRILGTSAFACYRVGT